MKKYLPIQINSEWHLRTENKTPNIPGEYGFIRAAEWSENEEECLATAKHIINHDGREWYDSSDLQEIWQYYDFQEQVWKTTDTQNVTVFENTFEQYSEFYRKTRQAWKYIGEKPVEKAAQSEQSEMVKKSEVMELIDYIIQAYESDNKFGSNPKPVAALVNFKNYFNEKFNS